MKPDSIIVIGRDFKISETRGKGSKLSEKIKIGEFSAETLKTELSKITNSLTSVIEDTATSINEFGLDEVSIKLEVSASGQVAILGNGVSATGTGGIELKFKRKS